MIIRTLASLAMLAALAGQAQAYSGEIYQVCRLDPAGDNFLALRACPSTDCREIMRLGPRTYLWTTEPFSESGGWRHVIRMDSINDEYPVNRPTGYVYDRYICEVHP